DRDSSAVCVVPFTPLVSGRYTLRMKNYRSIAPGFCAMVLLRESSSGRGSLQELAEALRNALVLSRTAGLFSSQFADGNFCLFGGRLAPGQDTYLYNMHFEDGNYLLLSAGSAGVRDVDSAVLRQYRVDSEYGVNIAQDSSPDVVAVCKFATTTND